MQRATTPPPQNNGFTKGSVDTFSKSAADESQELRISRSSPPGDIVGALTSRLGREWVLWEPETLWAEIRRAGRSPDEALRSKIQAIKTLFVTDAFWRDHLAFEKVVMALNNQVPAFDQYQNPGLGMIAYAIQEAGKIREGDYSDDVLRYIATVAYQNGLVVLPEPLSVAQGHLDTLTAGSVGRQLKESIRRAWDDMKVNKAPEGMYTETVTGVHLAKMAAIQEYARSI